MFTFTDYVAREICNYTKTRPRKLRESVWGLGFTKTAPRQIFSLSKMFLAVPGVSYGFTMKPTEEPLRFIVSFFERRGDEDMRNLGDEVHHVAKIDDVPKVVENAARKARELADALHLAANSSYGTP